MENVIEIVVSERPVYSNMGKPQARVPSDALAAHLCSEIAHGPNTQENVGPEGLRTLSLHTSAAKSPKAKLSINPCSWFSMAFGP